MTAQVHELLIIEGEETSMAYCPPLPTNHPAIKSLTDAEIRDVENMPSMIFSTACWRQYIGTWELKEGKLYLRDIKGRYKMTGDEPIFADWVTAVIRIPNGELLHYVHMGFGSVYEFENHIKIENGIVVDERRIDNRKKDISERDLGWENLPGNENKFDGDDF
jgi:hypothetical protein